MAGFGSMPCGSGPYGINTPVTAAGNEGPVLADDLGAVQGARYINPRTRQYEFDANGRYKGMPNVRQLMLLAFLTVKGSSAVPTLGIEEPSGVIGRNFVERRRESIRQAVAPHVRARLVEILSIDIDVTNRPVFTLVRWKDLTTEIEHEDRI